MKKSLFITFAALIAVLSMSAHAIPPAPPAPTAESAPGIVTCRDFNEYSSEELEVLSQQVEDGIIEIVSLDETDRSLCIRGL